MKKGTKKINKETKIENIQWTRAESVGKRINLSDFSISFTNKTNKHGHLKCYIYLNPTLVKKMLWETGDRLAIFYHPNNKYHWMITKAATGNKLGKCGKDNRLSFFCCIPNIKPMRLTSCDFEIQKDRVTCLIPIE